MKYTLTLFALFSLLMSMAHPVPVSAESAGDLIKCEDFTSVYYLDADDMRWVFPNENVFYSWYEDFDDVEEISCDDLADYKIGGLITYQPGTRLVKIPSIPTVYAVEPGGRLRAIEDEDQAEEIFGSDWASLVDDLSEAFFSSYVEEDEMEEGEIPEGWVLEDEDDSYFWVSDDDELIEIDELVEDDYGSVPVSAALSFEDVEDRLDADFFIVYADDDDDDVLDEPRVLFESVTPHEQRAADLLTVDFKPPEGAADDDGGSEYGPWNSRLLIATSENGTDFEKTGEIVSDQADVPDLVLNEDGWIFLYYIGWAVGEKENAMAVAISTDEGETWAHKAVHLEGFDDEDGSAVVDPDVQLLDDGMFRLYATYDPDDGDGPRTYSALSYDGIHFEEEGEAFEQNGDKVLDPSVLLIEDTWHLFAGGETGEEGGNWHATSEDGEEFEDADVETFNAGDDTYQFSNGIVLGDGYRFYAFSNEANDIRSFFSEDGDDWKIEDMLLRVDQDEEDEFVKDAAVVEISEDNFLMVYVTHIPE